MVFKVSNVKEFTKYLENKKINYEVIDKKIVNVFDKVDITKIVLAISKKNCTIEEMYEVNETLENYYMNLIGGENND